MTGSAAAAALDHDVTILASLLGVDRKVKVVEALKTDAVTGGCLLSAAELDSSKNYIQIDDQWQIAYMVRIEVMLFLITYSFMTSIAYNSLLHSAVYCSCP